MQRGCALKRVEALLAHPDFQAYVARNEEKETTRRFCRHGFQHLVDVARIAYILMLENGNIEKLAVIFDLNRRTVKELIYAAAFLHDIGRWQEYETGQDHAVMSAELAVDILAETGFSQIESGLITAAIIEHRRWTENMSMLGQHLFKADKFSRLCGRCDASAECYKFEEMATARKGLIY
jgi:HD superfamily phosphodiesterase